MCVVVPTWVVLLVVLGSTGFAGSSGSASSTYSTGSTDGRLELMRVRTLAAHPQFGGCWSEALEELDSTCKHMTAETLSRLALRFTLCHLDSSGQPFPSCPQRSEVSMCTTKMDAIAFGAYTEFFTHAQSICQHLEREAWQTSAETTIDRLTQSSIGVSERLESTRQLAEDLLEAQSSALISQEAIVHNTEELQHTLQQSAHGLREVFSEMRASSREQQLVLVEMFNRVAFLQTFVLSETHVLGCVLYNGLALATSYLLTATPRTAQARLLLFGLVFVNVYLERLIYRWLLDSDTPAYHNMELVAHYVAMLRWVMVAAGVLVLLSVGRRYRDVAQENLEVLRQLRETQATLQKTVRQAEILSASQGERRSKGRSQNLKQQKKKEKEEKDELGSQSIRKERREGEEEEGGMPFCPSLTCLDNSELSELSVRRQPQGWNNASVLSSTLISAAEDLTITHNAMSSRDHSAVQSYTSQHAPVNPSKRRPSSSLPLIHRVMLEDRQRIHPHYSLRSRRSDTHTHTH